MAQGSATDVVDSLLVSLGLDVDAKSFRTATDTINGLKSSFLQLGAAAGVGLGFNSATFGLSTKINEIQRLGRITNFTAKQVEGLQFALKKVGVTDDGAAYSIAQKIPSIQQAAREGRLNNQAYWNGAFNPTEFASLNGQDAVQYLVESYSKMNNDQQRTLRGGLGAGDNDPLTRLMEVGGSSFKDINEQFEKLYKETSPELIKNSAILNSELADLSQNFENLRKGIGEDLLGPLISIIQVINDLMEKFPDQTKLVAYLMGAGAAGGAWKITASLFGRQAASTFGAGLLANPVIATILGIIAPGNAFVEKEDAQAMSDPIKNWQKNNPGKELPAGVKDWKTAYMDQLENGGMSANEKGYLDIISRAEGTASKANNGYQTLYGGNQFSDFNDHPRQYFEHNGSRTSAAGRYQITASSWDDARQALGLQDFSPANQDKAALWLAERAGQGDNIKSGNYQAATSNLKNVWTGLRNNQAPDMLAGYQSTANSVPDMSSAGGSQVTIHQVNHNTVQAGGADADEVVRRMDQKTTTDLSQALALHKTDKF
ncbi:lysozyme [Buttiauxella sp. B2]|uniref:glycoside hydrolase family 24 protein n=1 Tax=Buttiauxella sp. B2 TaxID=2587812 RepID=UPI0011245D1C|nr:glycoside hydrolase family 104 protein [Buttiauxella sp. B2]TNV22827.1 lysozyme [Buttiauxella sp. B2]